MSKGGYARAVFEFVSQHPEDVSLKGGDVVQVLEDVDNNWLKGKNHNKVGYFPRSYIEPLRLPDCDTDQRLFLAIKPFIGEVAGDLSFNEGDVILGLRGIDSNWWQARLDHCHGIIPLTHVVELYTAGDRCNVWGLATKQPSPWQPVIVGSLVTATSNLTAQLDDELTLVCGDIIRILHDLGDGFAIGECNGHVGQFPMSFVEYQTSELPHHQQQVELKKSHCRKSSYTLANTSSSESSIQPYCSTLYAFNGLAGQLSFDVGQIIHLVAHVDDDWCYGELDGRFGMFPTCYVDIIVDCIKTVSVDIIDGHSDTKVNSENVTPLQTGDTVRSHSVTQTGKDVYGRAVCDFTASHSAEISVHEGDTVTILEQCGSDWLRVQHDNGSVGLCPSSYVELFTALPMSSHKPKPPAKPKALSTLNSFPSNSIRHQVHVPVLSATGSKTDQAGSAGMPSATGIVSPVGAKSTAKPQLQPVIPPAGPVATPRVSTSKQHSTQLSPSEVVFPVVTSTSYAPVERNTSDWQLNKPSPPPRPASSCFKASVATGPSRPVLPSSGKLPQPASAPTFNNCKLEQTTPHYRSRDDLIEFSPEQGVKAVDVMIAENEQGQIANTSANTSGNISANTSGNTSGNPVDFVQKRHETRDNVIAELLSTESDYCFSLKLCMETFCTSRSTCRATLTTSNARTAGCSLLPEEMDSLFSNLIDIVAISQKLLNRLQSDVKEKPFREQIVGKCFVDLKDEIQKIYAPYCRNHDSAIALLEKYENNDQVMEFINGKLSIMRQQSTVFDLGSILIKPVQRILKYPLLLSELVKATEEDHVDKHHLLTAVAAMTDVAAAINEYKRRKDLVLKYKKDAKLTERIGRLSVHSTKKKLFRISQKMVGIQTIDENFLHEEQKFKAVDTAVRTVARDISVYLEQLEECVMAAEQVSIDVRDFYDEESSRVDSVCVVNSNISASVFTKFKADVERLVIPPLNSLLLMFQGPANVIRKRYDKLLDYDNASKRLDGTSLSSDELVKFKVDYEAINAQLLDDLPKLFILSMDILVDVVHHFLRLQQTFYNQVIGLLTRHLQLSTSSLKDIIETFNVSHVAVVEHLSNISLIPAAFNPQIDEIRRTQQSPIGSMSCWDTATNQTDTHKTYLCSSYPGNNLYIVCDNVTASQMMDLSVNKGTLVGVIKQGDPMGNKDRWYVDTGATKGFIAQQFLSVRHNQQTIQQDLLSWSEAIDPSVQNSQDILSLLDPLVSSPATTSSCSDDLSQLLMCSATIDSAHVNRPRNASWEQFTEDKSPTRQLTVDAAMSPTATGSFAQCRVLYTFTARDSSEVSVSEGDLVKVTQQSDLEGNSEWWLVVGHGGQQGYVPANYLTLV